MQEHVNMQWPVTKHQK